MEVTTPDGQVLSVSEIRLTSKEARVLLRALEQALAPDPDFEDVELGEGQVVLHIAGPSE